MALQAEYMLIPPVTKGYTTACVITTLAVELGIVTPLQIYFNPQLIFREFELWRLVTSFLYLGPLGYDFAFNLFFIYHYSRLLEEGSFRGRTSDYVFMFFIGGGLMAIIGIYLNLLFLGQSFSIMMVYIWCQRNPHSQFSFFGMATFRAPYLPLVLIGLSLMMDNLVVVDLLGFTCGHIYYFLEDVFPEQERGFKIFKTPKILKYLFDERQVDEYQPMPEND